MNSGLLYIQMCFVNLATFVLSFLQIMYLKLLFMFKTNSCCMTIFPIIPFAYFSVPWNMTWRWLLFMKGIKYGCDEKYPKNKYSDREQMTKSHHGPMNFSMVLYFVSENRSYLKPVWLLSIYGAPLNSCWSLYRVVSEFQPHASTLYKNFWQHGAFILELCIFFNIDWLRCYCWLVKY